MVHRRVGISDQGFRVIPVVGVDANAHADTDIQVVLAELIRRLEGMERLFCKRHGVFGTFDSRKQYDNADFCRSQAAKTSRGHYSAGEQLGPPCRRPARCLMREQREAHAPRCKDARQQAQQSDPFLRYPRKTRSRSAIHCRPIKAFCRVTRQKVGGPFDLCVFGAPYPLRERDCRMWPVLMGRFF